MDLELNKPSGAQPVTAVREIQLAKIGLELYLGQALKATVLNQLSGNEVSLNINGQNINAKTSHHFTPGDTIDLKVISTQDEIVLQVQPKELPNSAMQKTILQNALLQALPKQAPPTNLLDNLTQLVDSGKLPPALNQQIKTFLANITSLSQLAQQLPKAVDQSGLFLESHLLQWQPGTPSQGLSADLKNQYLKLLDSLPATLKNSLMASESNPAIKRDTLPLPGAIPQPLHKDMAILNLMDKSAEAIQSVIHAQISQVLSRITASQINHLSAEDNKNGFLIMMDIPVKTSEKDIDVIPLMIKQRNATATQPMQWSMSFAVSLSELGDMQGTVSLIGNDVNVKINADKAEAINVLQDYQAEMSTLLDELGLKLGDFNVRLGLENNHIQAENLHLLDIRI